MSSINTNSQQELFARIKELEEEVTKLKSRKKYGLVWEDKPEDVVLECEQKIPVLKEIKNRKIVTSENSPTNLLVEGDNYHALSVLNYTHKGKIDVIYIDPPYNTGNKDFIYNDDYVDKEDSFRHSKWLSFMEKRLKLAKELLKDSGVIFISIDDNEQAQLKLLCDSVFGENNFVNNIIWQRASGGGNAKGIVTGHDYIFVYQKSMPLIDFLGDPVDEKRFSKDKIIEKDGKKFYIDDDVVRKVFGKYESGIERRCYYEELQDYKNEKQISEIKNKIENGELFLIKQKNGNHFIAKLQSSDERKKMYSIIQGVLNNQGANEMENLGIEFTYPKPSLLLKKIINSVPDKNIKILDFMAGSGTTGHAVMELNKEDGGNRQFILCTNNENNICEEVTYERLKRVIRGYENKKGDKVEGLGGNLEYLKCDFIDKTRHTDNMKMRLMRACSEMLCLKENTFEIIKEVKDGETLMYRLYKGIKIDEDGNNKEHIVGIYYDLDDSCLEDMRNDMKKYEDAHKTAYIFSLRNVSDFIDDYRKWRGIQIEEVPQKILEIYESIYKRNNRT